jgi:oxygen-independent coproporphyrinogen III oxidase
MVMKEKDLIQKYNVPGPRYTSYPTVPFWKENQLNNMVWQKTIVRNFNTLNSNQISLYIHLPYCESLCTFCGCHKRITKNHQVEAPYIDGVIKEWQNYLANIPFKPEIKELHFGGGTPTFFNVKELIRLLKAIFNSSDINPEEVSLSFEAHPNNTTREHLQELYNFGFRRLSLGIQDYSPVVQKAIHRIQSFEQVKKVHELAKEIGYTSISHDLIFGLPKQTLTDIKDSISKTLELKPERISLYSYAHVPWIKGTGQRGYDENDLPKNEEKRILYETAKHKLEAAGYHEVGMDHFALASDELAIAMKTGDLHRNFMGYTTQNTKLMIGLGMSAISDSWFGFAQNEKTVEKYLERVQNGEIPIFRGHILSELDLAIREHILNLMCRFETEIQDCSIVGPLKNQIFKQLEEMIADDLVIIEGNRVKITSKGIPFVRNCCMAFDQDLQKTKEDKPRFSQTI